MPPRKSHRKSHKGCIQCKSRHVKCDEVPPVCGQCTRRELPCSYQSQGPTPDSMQSTSSTPILSPVLPVPLPDSSPNRIMELELLHHYSTSTYKTLTEMEGDLENFQLFIPKLALSHPYLLDAIFALSALHLDHLADDSGRGPSFWFQTALDYQQRTLNGFSKALSRISPENSSAVAACSILILQIAIALSDDTANPSNPAMEILKMRNLIQGVAHIFVSEKEALQTGELGRWFTQIFESSEERERKLAVELQTEPYKPKFWTRGIEERKSGLHRSVIQRLENLLVMINTTGIPNKPIYVQMCQSLRVQESQQPANDIFCWPLRTTKDAIELVESGDPLACLIVIHWGVMMDLIADRWFVKDAGKRTVKALLPFLRDVPPEWIEIVEWAKKAVGIP